MPRKDEKGLKIGVFVRSVPLVPLKKDTRLAQCASRRRSNVTVNWFKQMRSRYIRAAQRAQQIAHRAVLAGKLPDLKRRKVKCEDCNKRACVYDHRDYAQPLEVAPVCNGCNIRRGKATISKRIIPNLKFRYFREKYLRKLMNGARP